MNFTLSAPAHQRLQFLPHSSSKGLTILLWRESMGSIHPQSRVHNLFRPSLHLQGDRRHPANGLPHQCPARAHHPGKEGNHPGHQRRATGELYRISKVTIGVDGFHCRNKWNVHRELHAHFNPIAMTRLSTVPGNDLLSDQREGGRKGLAGEIFRIRSRLWPYRSFLRKSMKPSTGKKHAGHVC